MIALSCSLLTGALLFAAPPKTEGDALASAKAHLTRGELDDVLFDLQSAKGEDEARADVLAEAGRQALEKHDSLLALQFAQMALRANSKHTLALETGARSALAQQQFEAAEGYNDRWIQAEPKSAPARMLRAEIALQNADWDKVISALKDVDPGQLSAQDRGRMKTLISQAAKELQERAAAREESRTMDRALAMQMARIDAVQRTQVQQVRAQPEAQAKYPQVIVYGTSWCGWCAKTKSWLKERHIPFVEKDIEKDPDAAAELQAKKAKVGKSNYGGVPWIDVGGEMVVGFDQPALERLLHG